jgi:alpha-glucosidase
MTLIKSEGCQSAAAQSTYSLRSPDQRIEVQLRASDRLSYDVLLNGGLLLQNSTLSMKINRTNLGAQPRVRTTKQRTENKEVISPVPQKSVRIREHYNELKLEMEGDYAVVFRAFNEGVAYRFETSLAVNEAKVMARKFA